MVRSITRRVASAVVAGAMTVGVAAFGQILWGAGVAAADPVSQTITTDNIIATKTVSPAVAHPGDTVTSTITFKTSSGFFSVDRYLQNLTDFPPAGYVLQGVSGNVWRGATANLNSPALYDGAAVQNPTNGSVTIKWTDATLALGLIPGQGNGSKNPTLTFTYKVAADAQPGPRSTGMGFDIYSFTSYQAFNPMTNLNVSVDPVSTTTTVTAPATAVAGTPVTLTANVAPPNAAGSVQFKDNGTDIGAPVPVSGGQASTSYAFPTAGAHSVTAVFTGSSSTFANSTSQPRTVTVTAADVQTSTTLTAPSDAKTGTSVLLSATVTPPNATGTVRFRDNGADIGTPVPVSGGAASLQYTFTTTGSHDVVAVFTAGNGFVGSTSQMRTVVVTEPAPNDVATSTTLTAPASATVGLPVQLSAQVSGGANLPGTVQFYDGAAPIGTAQTVSGGTVALTYTFTTPGVRELRAVYSGGPGFTGSASATQSIQVSGTDTGGGDGSSTGSAGSLGNLPIFGS
ncbi:Ig-like domain-containing protein [Prescottella defluvii]|nr:Ig-like domain-containing protein [Prescottella defluvii]